MIVETNAVLFITEDTLTIKTNIWYKRHRGKRQSDKKLSWRESDIAPLRQMPRMTSQDIRLVIFFSSQRIAHHKSRRRKRENREREKNGKRTQKPYQGEWRRGSRQWTGGWLYRICILGFWQNNEANDQIIPTSNKTDLWGSKISRVAQPFHQNRPSPPRSTSDSRTNLVIGFQAQLTQREQEETSPTDPTRIG